MDNQPTESYQEIELDVGKDDVEAVANYIIENISNGLVFEDQDDTEKTKIRFYVASELDIKSRLEGLRKYLIAIDSNRASLTLQHKEIKSLDWIEAYQKSVAAIEIGDSIIIKPPWDQNSYPGKTEIILEPKMAFGTGRHETSRSCLAELETMNLAGTSMLDLGCGSGILSIFAALRGATCVDAFDIDQMALENSRENFILNGTESVCRAERGTINKVSTDARYDIVVANIIKEVILPILGQLRSHVKPSGRLILSGLMAKDQDTIDKSLCDHNMKEFNIRRDAEWLTYNIRIK